MKKEKAVVPQLEKRMEKIETSQIGKEKKWIEGREKGIISFGIGDG
jgi:hypothetical protein